MANSDTILERYYLERICEFIMARFANLAQTYTESSLEQKRILLCSIFPVGVPWVYPGLSHTKIHDCYTCCNTIVKNDAKYGGPKETRTPRLRRAKAALYRMSYGPEITVTVFYQVFTPLSGENVERTTDNYYQSEQFPHRIRTAAAQISFGVTVITKQLSELVTVGHHRDPRCESAKKYQNVYDNRHAFILKQPIYAAMIAAAIAIVASCVNSPVYREHWRCLRSLICT